MIIDTTKPVDRTGNAYCGPLVVAAILGTSTGIVADKLVTLRKVRGGALRDSGRIERKRARSGAELKSATPAECFALLRLAGIKAEPVDVGAKLVPMRKARGWVNYVDTECHQMLRRRDNVLPAGDWLRWSPLELAAKPLWQVALKLNDGATYVVQTANHWAIVSDGKWCETFTRGQWVPLASAPKSNRKILKAWRVIL